jgi:hypothetical protein
MKEITPEAAYGLAYRTYRVWGDYWRDIEPFSNRTPPLYHFGRTPEGAALIIAPCSANELESFFTSSFAENSLCYKIETSELGSEWIGFWCLFSVATKVKD